VDEETMKFSLFFEMQLSRPTRSSEAQVFRDCVEQALLADALGYHCIWEVEHHGLFEYSHSSAPEVFLAFIAGRTKRIRLGHGVTLLPNRYNHPIRIAERIATLDILSGGRVNWGTGKSSSASRAAGVRDQSGRAARTVAGSAGDDSADVVERRLRVSGRFCTFRPRRSFPSPCRSRTRPSSLPAPSPTPPRSSAASVSERSTSPSAPTTT
jgi:alkanesulfonate monooxygenase SsuD/methylene tetrahydromethanopterin reductase-like flavin-dependent oxidoreductase (luciferase family)